MHKTQTNTLVIALKYLWLQRKELYCDRVVTVRLMPRAVGLLK